MPAYPLSSCANRSRPTATCTAPTWTDPSFAAQDLHQFQAFARSGFQLDTGCAGFKLDTLLKLADVKGTDRKTSLLHFVLEQLLKEENASVGTLSTQLKSIHPAANLQVN